MSKQITWKDATHYSRGDKERIPSVWDAEIGPVRVTVLTSNIYYRGRWVYLIRPLMDDVREIPGGLAVDDVAGAQRAALRLVREALHQYAVAFARLTLEKQG